MLGEPPAVKVFGILHLVFAAFGLIGAGWGLFVALVGNPFLKFSPAGQMDAQVAMQTKISPMTITSGILSLLVAIPMIIAGIQLLQKRRNGLKWSNTNEVVRSSARRRFFRECGLQLADEFPVRHAEPLERDLRRLLIH